MCLILHQCGIMGEQEKALVGDSINFQEAHEAKNQDGYWLVFNLFSSYTFFVFSLFFMLF